MFTDSYFLSILNSSWISGSTMSVAGIYKLPVAPSTGSEKHSLLPMYFFINVAVKFAPPVVAISPATPVAVSIPVLILPSVLHSYKFLSNGVYL
ncbi:hypothetical protein E4V82_23160 [Clostridium estertheticum]|uniref:Uncharacterized protein n=1 Tax=Clostridium estertheticum TaxID=238834 RepID=A0A5N7J8E3_9CLOT|nr:hypothetical protein [Clostridium estertheticum]MPQ64965.1 hypothetical protein [Clostridium estertheticum]